MGSILIANNIIYYLPLSSALYIARLRIKPLEEKVPNCIPFDAVYKGYSAVYYSYILKLFYTKYYSSSAHTKDQYGTKNN